MRLFGKNDELFEIMSRRHDRPSGEEESAPRISWRHARPGDDFDLYEVGGDALVVVDDGWDDAVLEDANEAMRCLLLPPPPTAKC